MTLCRFYVMIFSRLNVYEYNLYSFLSISDRRNKRLIKNAERPLLTFAHEALAYGATRPDLQPHRDLSYEVYGEEYWVYHLPVQTLVIATICQYQVVTSHSYANFHSIDNLRQVLLDQYMERRGTSSIKPHLQKVYQDSSWEGCASAILRHIPVDDEIEGLYDIYTGRPVAAPAPSDSSTGSLFGAEPSDSSTGSLSDDYR
jgi:hypothetical protein